MAKLIIFITGYPRIQGLKRGEFEWSEAHQCYLFQGREFDETNFNPAAEIALRRYAQMFPMVKVIVSQAAATVPPVTVDELPPEEPSDAERLAAAIAIIERLAPDRLKKKPGPRPASKQDEQCLSVSST